MEEIDENDEIEGLELSDEELEDENENKGFHISDKKIKPKKIRHCEICNSELPDTREFSVRKTCSHECSLKYSDLYKYRYRNRPEVKKRNSDKNKIRKAKTREQKKIENDKRKLYNQRPEIRERIREYKRQWYLKKKLEKQAKEQNGIH